MYVDAYIQRLRGSERLMIAERRNGKRVLTHCDPVYEYYVEDPRGEYKTIRGTKAIKKEFPSSAKMREEKKRDEGRKLYESDRNVTFKTLRKYYKGKGSPDLHVAFFDIETDFHKKYGYAPPSDPFNRVTAISLYQTWTGEDFVLVMPPESMDLSTARSIVDKINKENTNPLSTVILYTDEKEMFEMFFDLIEDADVLSGWNSEFFDIPYMVNRTERIFDKTATTRFCLWLEKPREREADNYGKTIITYDLVGRIHLDYLALYKKHAGKVMPSYTLDFIGGLETGENKVQYEGSLDKLYNEDFERFIMYSKQDSILLKKIDEKLDYISLHNRLAHQESVLISTTMGSVALIDTAIINLIHERGQVVFDKPPRVDNDDEIYDDEYDDGEDPDEEALFDISTAKAAGAWVQDPILGLIDALGCADFNSLYPTVLRTLGMSTETIMGQVRQTYTVAYLESKLSEQRMKYRGKKFVPDWTAAWHGLFASVEFTMIQDKTDDLLDVDLEDGSTFQVTAAELHDIIYAEDSTIVMSANGTLFDRTKDGAIPAILTQWYNERKQQQKMVIDYKHLCSDGWALSEEQLQALSAHTSERTVDASARLFKTNIHYDDPVFKIRQSLAHGDFATLATLIADNGLVVKDMAIFCHKEDKSHCKVQSAFWKQNQQIRKILLNSLYGALLNSASTFYDVRLGQSVTLTGRSMTKHLASKINEVCGLPYSHTGGVVVYGDTDSVYFSVAQYYKDQNMEFDFTKDEVVELYIKIGDTVGESFPQFMHDTFNTGIEKGEIVGADLEMVGSRGLFLKKKRYAILKYWEDGFRKDVDGSPGEIKAMGLEIKRSDTPKYIQKFLEETLVSLLTGADEATMRTQVRAFKKEFKDKPSIDKGSPKTVKKLSHHTEIFNKTGKCSVGHVLAAIQWNRLREAMEDMSVPEAVDGSKMIVCKLKNNPYGIKNIGYPLECKDYLPDWFLELPFDDAEMEQAVLTKKLENIFGILDMDIAIYESSTMVDNPFFNFK